MRNLNFNENKQKSLDAMNSLPEGFLEWFLCGDKGGEFYCIEEKSDCMPSLYNILDSDWGTDYIVRNQYGTFGISSRVQLIEDYVPHNSFTIGQSEYKKRSTELENGTLKATHQMQFYFSLKNNLLSAGLISTKRLYEFIDRGGWKFGGDSKKFIYIKWTDLLEEDDILQQYDCVWCSIKAGKFKECKDLWKKY